MPFFSIIAPVFNKESELPECLDSIQNQSFGEWEAIFVIDGSTDKSESIISRYASDDERIKVLNKESNEGTHRARRDGALQAQGRYILFLDPDDKLVDGALEQIYDELSRDANAQVDIFHYGMTLFGVNGVPDEVCNEVEAYGNQPFRPLRGKEICEAAFLGIDGCQQDWRVVQRVFDTKLCQDAFKAMTDSRLGRGQDSYEYFVISTLANLEVTRNDLVGYEYFFGGGVTNFDPISSDKFLGIASQFQTCINAVHEWSQDFKGFDTQPYYENYKEEMLDLLMNDWDLRVDGTEKIDVALGLSEIIGGDELARQLCRLSRDRAYEIWESRRSADERHCVYDWLALAESVVVDTDNDLYKEYRLAAHGHLSDIEMRLLDAKNAKSKPSIVEFFKELIAR